MSQERLLEEADNRTAVLFWSFLNMFITSLCWINPEFSQQRWNFALWAYSHQRQGIQHHCNTSPTCIHQTLSLSCGSWAGTENHILQWETELGKGRWQIHGRDAESVEFERSTIPRLAWEPPARGAFLRVCIAAGLDFLGRKIFSSSIKSHHLKSPSPCFSPGVILLLQWICAR